MPRTKGTGFTGFGESDPETVKVVDRSRRFPGSEKRGMELGLMLVSTPLRLGVGMPGMENTVVGMMDCRSSLVVLEDEDMAGGTADVKIPPPECKAGCAIWSRPEPGCEGPAPIFERLTMPPPVYSSFPAVTTTGAEVGLF
jgi:hypothetical protein